MKQLSNRGQKSGFRKAYNTVIPKNDNIAIFFFILSILLTMAWPFTFSVDVHTPSSLKNYANKIRYPRTNPTFLQHFWDFTYIWIYILNALEWNFFWSIFRLRIQLVCKQTWMYLRISIFNIFATLKLAKFNYLCARIKIKISISNSICTYIEVISIHSF